MPDFEDAPFTDVVPDAAHMSAPLLSPLPAGPQEIAAMVRSFEQLQLTPGGTAAPQMNGVLACGGFSAVPTAMQLDESDDEAGQHPWGNDDGFPGHFGHAAPVNELNPFVAQGFMYPSMNDMGD